jgi:hypothetical protein
MANPMSGYARSSDSSAFLEHYQRSIVKNTPQLDNRKDVIQDFGESYERAYMLWNTFYAEAYKDLSYYLGNQWSLEELSYLNNQRRSSFTYNKIRRLINLVQGYQRKNRLCTIISPVEDSASATADILTDAMQSVMTRSGGYEIISDAFKGALTTGLSFVSPYMDYRDDPVSGDIKYHLDEWNAVILDPFFTKRDLSDCGFVSRRKYLGRTEVISLHPDKEDLIMALPWGSRDDKFTYMPFARQWGMQKLLNYTEYWKTKWETKDVLVDMNTGETQEWKGDRKRLRLLTEMVPELQLIRKPVKSVELGVICEGELLYYGSDPMGLNDYPFVPFTAIFEPSYDLYTWKLQSLVRIVRDPQTELNKRRSKMVDIIDAQLNSGWVAKTGAVSNNASLFKSGNGQVIFLKPEAQMTDIQRIEAPQIPASMFQLEAEFEKDIMEIAGVNPELFGMAENDKVETAGVLAKQRQAAGLVNLQDIFDGLRQSQKILGEKTMKMMQKNFTPEKIKQMTKKDPTPEFFSGQFSKYDVVVEEGLLTDTQKQTQFIQLTALKSLGVSIPDSLIIKNSSLQNRKDLEDYLKQQADEAAKVQKQHEQLQLQEIQVANNAINAKAASDEALAAERTNKISLDAALSAERISRAEEDRTAGVLNLIKAVKELESIDIETLMRKVEILKLIESGQEVDEKKSTPVAANQ